MQITDDHVEWAVVSRLQKMLTAPPHLEFNVTHTYALFVPILCWTMQRIRKKPETEVDNLAAGVLKKLQGQKVEDSPWNIATDRSEIIQMTKASVPSVGPFDAFRNMSVDRFVINLRNAVAHGDGRRVRPFHQSVAARAEHELVGFSFDCEETTGSGKAKKVEWSGTITLLEPEMRRIGIALAETFCKALRHGEHRHDSSFGHDAAHGVIERAA